MDPRLGPYYKEDKMQASIEALIGKLNLMHDLAVDMHRERCRYSEISHQEYDHDYCKRILDDIQAHAGDIYNDRQGDEIKTEMEYKKL
jgi:hypothetical protein|tara:strand:+ start:298 stop:561 length:264 start_codon:yes stop_codon:yes gene_type:complete